MISKLIGIISTITYIIFSILLNMLNMIPQKYLIVFFVIFIVLYLIMILFVFCKRIKKKLRIIAVIFFVIFGLIFGIGIKYLNDTINFFDIINDKVFQREVYYVMTLKSSKIKTVNELKNESIGMYNSLNSELALKKLQKKVTVKSKEFKDVTEMFEELQNKKIFAILINESTKALLETDLSDIGIELKEIDKVYVSIEKEDIVKVADITKKTFNVYVAGGDAFGSIENVSNTDVNMIITVDPIKRKILLTSIPRDYYVNLPSFGGNAYDKLTHAGYYGIEESVKSIENLLDIDINYYAKVNFSTVVGIIDAIGGIDVYSDFKFTTHNNEETEYYTYYVGMNHLNGTEALAFARERYSFADGDIQRVKNQQKVLEAVFKKITTSTKIISSYSKILDSVSENFVTNMDTKSINKFVKMQLNDMRGWDIESNNLVGTDLYTTETFTFPGTKLYVMQQDEESVNQARSKIKEYIKK